jgi:hypothetical protein
VVGSAFIYWTAIRLKRVAMDDKGLYVSNYRQEIFVPFRDVGEVTENRWIDIHPVTIRFQRDTDFGNSIVFMPKARWFSSFANHPVVPEIRAAVARAHEGPNRPAA